MTWWPFRPKRRVVDLRNDNEGWRVGDLAQCVEDDWMEINSFNPRAGDVLRVKKVREGIGSCTGDLMIALEFERKPGGYGWQCTCFRKLRPEIAAADETFVAQIRDIARKVETV